MPQPDEDDDTSTPTERRSGRSGETPAIPRRRFLGRLAGLTGLTVGSAAVTGGTGAARPSRGPAAEAPAIHAGRGGQARPNILFIFSDDHTVQSIGAYTENASIATVSDRLAGIARSEQIDRIAAEGVRLNHCFCTNAICVPSRASMLSGQYSHENGAYTLSDSFDPAHPNVAKELRAAGYRTGLVGKWHLKDDPAGFDYWLRLPGQGRYFDPRMKEKGSGAYEVYEGFSSDVITDRSIAWMREQLGRDEPFCMMTQFKCCHGPFAYPARNEHLFRNTSIPEPPSLWEDKDHRSPGSREYGLSIETMAHRLVRDEFGGWDPHRPLEEMGERELRRHAYQRFVKRYLRSAAAIDQGVGRLLEFLDAEGLAGETLVVYSSDQGYFLGEHNYIDKRWMFEESLRMPFVARFPGRIEQGSVVRDLILNVDFAPTLLEFAGVRTPDYMQGRSFAPQLRGTEVSDWREGAYYRYYHHTANGDRPAHYGLRTRRYKLIFYYGLPLGHGDLDRPTKPGMELYDLARDPREMDNVYDDPAYREVADSLERELLEKKEELGDVDRDSLLLERRSHFF